MSTVTVLDPTSAGLRARSVAFALLARMLGADVRSLTDPPTVDALHAALVASGRRDLADRLGASPHADLPPVEQLAGRWVRWFDLGRVAPYEGSNVAATAAGITPRLADIAGFYRAFNVGVVHDRPDHIVAQLEFLALVLLAEAEALEAADPGRAAVAADTVRAFLRDHAGAWIPAWAARVGEIDELAPWFPYASTAAALVTTEAHSRHVIPLRDDAVLPADAGVPDDSEAEFTCQPN